MAQVSWLHLTDLHRGLTAQGWLWANVEQKFYEDIERTHASCGPLDFIIFTGDLAQSGTAKEYAKFTETLERLYKRLNALGSNPIFIAIPGNHDLVRPASSDPEVRRLLNWHDDNCVAEEFWTNPKSGMMRVVKRAFRPFIIWRDQHPFPRSKVFHGGHVPGDFITTIEKDGLRVGILGLNTAFLQLTGDNFEGKLAVSPRQLTALCGENFADWFSQHSFCLLLTHHPSSWLHPNDNVVLHSEIAVPGRFVAHFCGHLHESLAESRSVGGAETIRCYQGPSLFGLEKFGNPARIERRHGYIAGSVSTNPNPQIRIWPRRADKHKLGYWQFVQDTSFVLQQDGATKPEPFEIRQAMPSGKPRPSFRVLLISTDFDLAATRASIAKHLKLSTGVSVIEASEILPSHSFDVAALIQGWWWDDGIVSTLWNRLDKDKRLSFVADENGDWPPRKFVEISEDSKVREFRKTLEQPILFDRPENLPEIVSAHITQYWRNQLGDDDLGLKTWERTYLEFRLPAWISGRTALSRPHLFNPQDAKELYQPDLYTTLDGISALWQQDKSGNPQRRIKKQKSASEIGHDQPETRVRLARWLSVSEIPRIALVGAPGGGKTIFLTRVAAAFGHACLGRSIDFEPDLNIEALRKDFGLPIPIVLEATRINDQPNADINGLLNVISNEVGSAVALKPSNIELEAGLKLGRYFLLVDALDEIPDAIRRSNVLTLLKGVANAYGRTRMLLTTRSARYTGELRFGPELETIHVAPLSQSQVQQLCTNWTIHRKRDDEYRNALMSAVSGLGVQVSASSEDQALTENPLMLTAICMVFERYRSLPDDRGRLCDLLIEDLSEDIGRSWKLDETGKKDLLQRIALAMQQQGAQSWPVSKAIDIATQLVPTSDKAMMERAKRYVDWAADHTGILRFQEGKDGEEQIRFWHRIFREYLSANQLAQEDTTAGEKITKLWNEGRLTDPFWEDVIRLLPRTLGTIEKAKSLRERLQQLADENSKQRGRLLGLTAAGIIENRDLFPDVRFGEMADEMSTIYESEGLDWVFNDRVLFLEALGRLDPTGGDPRFKSERWFSSSQIAIELGIKKDLFSTDDQLYWAWAPVSVHEFQRFANQPAFWDDELWKEFPPFARKFRSTISTRLRSQYRHPNRPVGHVSVFEAIAYCRWKTRMRNDSQIVRLARNSELRALWKRVVEWTSTQDSEPEDTHLRRGTPSLSFPIGIFRSPCSLTDLLGNGWSWAFRDSREKIDKEDSPSFGVFGAHFRKNSLESVPGTFEYAGFPTIGFRCVLGKKDFKLTGSQFSEQPKHADIRELLI